MKKLALSILSIAGVVALAGCGESVTYVPKVIVEKLVPTKIYVDEPGFVLFSGETAQIHVNIRPLVAANADLVYESTNEQVAKVDEKGLITAVGGGSAVITVYAKENPAVCETVSVGVENNVLTGESEAELADQRKLVTDALAKQATVQSRTYGKSDDLTAVNVYNGFVTLTTKNGEHFYSEHARQDYTISRELGYFQMDIEDVEVRSPMGNPSFESFAYYFFCNEDFDAHVYKRSDSGNRRCKVNAQDLIGKVDRTEVVLMMLDQFFVARRKIFNNQFTNALETDEFKSPGNIVKGGFTGGGNTSVSFVSQSAPQKQIVPKNEEEDMGIPYGTQITYTQTLGFHWINGRIDSSFSILKMEYTLGEDEYVKTQTSYSKVYLEDEVTVTYPNKDNYQLVDGLFDL